jgi:hypothetical protein
MPTLWPDTFPQCPADDTKRDAGDHARRSALAIIDAIYPAGVVPGQSP